MASIYQEIMTLTSCGGPEFRPFQRMTAGMVCMGALMSNSPGLNPNVKEQAKV